MSRAPSFAVDPCPPPPFVLLGELRLPLGAPGPPTTTPVLGDVHAVGPPPGPRGGASTRARAAAMCARSASGVLVRATAVWVWTGATDLQPRVLDVAGGPGAPALPGPRPGRRRAGLPVRQLRLAPGDGWHFVGGTAVTGPTATAADCARSLPAPLARRCVLALVRTVDLDLTAVVEQVAGGTSRQGRRQALDLLDALVGPGPPSLREPRHRWISRRRALVAPRW